MYNKYLSIFLTESTLFMFYAKFIFCQWCTLYSTVSNNN